MQTLTFGGANMIAGLLKMHRPKQSWVLALSIALLAILVLFFQVAEVKADDQVRLNHWRVEKREQSSVEVLDGSKQIESRNHKKTLSEKRQSLALRCHGKGPKNKQNQTSGEETATEEKSKKRDACDVDPNTDNTETETASVEHKKSDSTVFYISVFGVLALLVVYILFMKAKKNKS